MAASRNSPVTAEFLHEKSNHHLFREDISRENKWPIVYSDSYNITFMGMEKLHPFDSTKWRNVFNYLKDKGMVSFETIIEPREPTTDDLLKFHAQKYLDSLKTSFNVARITEVPPVALIPNYFVNKYLLKKLRLQTGGTILAAKLALEKGWSINLGGGFHHCSAEQGGGFCAYADISGALTLLKESQFIQRALIVDLDAHQGNGHERDFLKSDWVTTLDVYNGSIYPYDQFAKTMENLMPVELSMHTKDQDYLRKVDRALKSLWDNIKDDPPGILAYNAGTDVLEGDPLGCLRITEEGIIQRDEIMFKFAKDKHLPIFMVLSGGYQRHTADIIARSILNLRDKKLIEFTAIEPMEEGVSSS